MSSVSSTFNPIDDVETDQLNKEAKRSRFGKSLHGAKKKAAVREAQQRRKERIGFEPETDEVTEAEMLLRRRTAQVNDRLPSGEPLRRPKYVGGQERRVSASVKRLRRSDRQQARVQCQEAMFDEEKVVTGSLPVQRASVRSLAVAAL